MRAMGAKVLASARAMESAALCVRAHARVCVRMSQAENRPTRNTRRLRVPTTGSLSVQLSQATPTARGVYFRLTGAGVAQLVTTLQTSLPVRVRIPAIPKRPWLRGRGPSPRARWFQWKICRGPLDEQKIPRGGARAVQPGMPFPNLYRCNKVLVNQKKKCVHGCGRDPAPPPGGPSPSGCRGASRRLKETQ